MPPRGGNPALTDNDPLTEAPPAVQIDAASGHADAVLLESGDKAKDEAGAFESELGGSISLGRAEAGGASVEVRIPLG
mgnify:CR=1 FL=1